MMVQKGSWGKHLTRRQFLNTCGAVGAGALAAYGAWSLLRRKSDFQFPDANIILVSIDTLRADHLGCYGYTRPTSPVIDALASKGILLETVVAQSPWTTPSHASIFTSLYPSELGLRRYPDVGQIPDSAIRLAEVLSQHGYTTAAFTDGGWVHSKFGFGKGFSIYNCEGGHLRAIFPRVSDWLKDNHSKRFFLFIHTYDVHAYEPPEEYAALFAGGYRGKLRPSKELRKAIQDWQNGWFISSLTDEDVDFIVGLYDAEIRYVDGYIGRLLELLGGHGILDNTLILLTSDHGEEFIEHGRTGHGYSMYEEQLRVPLIVSLSTPRPKPSRISSQVRLLDIMPTVLDLVGIEAAVPLRGRSLRPLLLGEKADLPAFSEKSHVYNLESIRDGGWKLVHRRADDHYELYDLAGDPGERTNLVQKEPAVTARLKQELTAWRSSLRLPEQALPTPQLTPDEEEQIRALGYTK